MPKRSVVVAGSTLSVSGRFLRIATVRDEPYECVSEPHEVIAQLRAHRPRVDLFSFMQGIGETAPRFAFHMEPHSLAIVPITTYDHWWNRQISAKTRNLIRKSQKAGVTVSILPLDERFVEGVKRIYDETPMRQGKPFVHYRKPLEQLSAELGTFPERSLFLGACFRDELIGFAKVVHGHGGASLMHILGKIGERDKAPANALIAKAVEACAGRGITCLHYGVWSAGGLGQFKTNHAFEKVDIPRYYVPITVTGTIGLQLGMHHRLSERLPPDLRARLVAIRSRLRNRGAPPASAPGQADPDSMPGRS
jgi:hypothetical protein